MASQLMVEFSKLRQPSPHFHPGGETFPYTSIVAVKFLKNPRLATCLQYAKTCVKRLDTTAESQPRSYFPLLPPPIAPYALHGATKSMILLCCFGGGLSVNSHVYVCDTIELGQVALISPNLNRWGNFHPPVSKSPNSPTASVVDESARR